MKNKVLVNINVPEIDKEFDIYVPTNKKIENIISLIVKAINEMGSNIEITDNNALIANETGIKYPKELLLKETNIINGSKLILLL